MQKKDFKKKHWPGGPIVPYGIFLVGINCPYTGCGNTNNNNF